MDALRVKSIKVTVRPGAVLRNVIAEARKLARTCTVDIVFMLNDVRVVVTPEMTYKQVRSQWMRKLCGEPEHDGGDDA